MACRLDIRGLSRGGARRAACGLVLAAACLPARAPANGWEHTAIPFESLAVGLRMEHVETRRRAAQSLGYRGEPRAVPLLLEALARPEPSPAVRGAAFAALGRLDDRRAVPAVVRCLGSEPSTAVRAECARAAGELADPHALDALLAALEDPSPAVRRRAVMALGSFRDARAGDALRRLARDPAVDVRLPALAALGRSGAAGAVAVLLEALARAADRRETLVVVDALGRLGDAAAGDALVATMAGSDDPLVRAHAAAAIGAVRDRDAMPALLVLLGDDSVDVRLHAIEALRRLARAEAAPGLAVPAAIALDALDALDEAGWLERADAVSGELRVLAATLRALADLDAARGLDVLLRACAPRGPRPASTRGVRLAEGVYEVRRLALYGLGYTASPRAADALAGACGIGDPDPRLRAAAVRSLGVLGDGSRLPEVRAALADPAPEVRWVAAMVIGRLGDADAGADLLDRLDDPYAEVRRQAALGLGYLGRTDAAASLARLGETDPSPTVREAAGFALRLMEGQR